MDATTNLQDLNKLLEVLPSFIVNLINDKCALVKVE